MGHVVVNDQEPKMGGWPTPAVLWDRLKPEARRMRNHPTAAEANLWEALRSRKLDGLRFRRQHAVGRFIVDFYCAESRLVVEVDGPIHRGIRDEDLARDAWLASQGLRVLRVANDRVEKDLDGVLEEIREALLAKDSEE